jgi:hypothetical protein
MLAPPPKKREARTKDCSGPNRRLGSRKPGHNQVTSPCHGTTSSPVSRMSAASNRPYVARLNPRFPLPRPARRPPSGVTIDPT